MAFPYKVISINLGEIFLEYRRYEERNRTDLNLGEIVYVSLVYHISDS